MWEIPQSAVVEMAADRGPFICQTQSMNLSHKNPTNKKITSAIFAGWKRGLKTGVYYYNTKALSDAQILVDEPVVSSSALQIKPAMPGSLGTPVTPEKQGRTRIEENRIQNDYMLLMRFVRVFNIDLNKISYFFIWLFLVLQIKYLCIQRHGDIMIMKLVLLILYFSFDLNSLSIYNWEYWISPSARVNLDRVINEGNVEKIKKMIL